MKLIYISGPISRGDMSANIRKAILAAERAVDLGHIPYVPHLSHLWDLISPHGHDYWMAVDREIVSRCDEVWRLPGESPGADEEVVLATELGITVRYWPV